MYKIDDVDKEIMNIMKSEPEITQSALGKKVNLSQPSTRRRLQRLFSENIMEIKVIIHSQKVK
jgi:DNA-binding Lrp family transcriptional regulator